MMLRLVRVSDDYGSSYAPYVARKKHHLHRVFMSSVKSSVFESVTSVSNGRHSTSVSGPVTFSNPNHRIMNRACLADVPYEIVFVFVRNFHSQHSFQRRWRLCHLEWQIHSSSLARLLLSTRKIICMTKKSTISFCIPKDCSWDMSSAIPMFCNQRRVVVCQYEACILN